MSKYILVIELDDDITEGYDILTIDYDVRGENINDNVIESIKYFEGAKLKLMPKKEELRGDMPVTDFDFFAGYNKCLDEILEADITGGTDGYVNSDIDLATNCMGSINFNDNR